MKCGIKHGRMGDYFGGQTCNREKGHDGRMGDNCWCKAECGSNTITYSDWVSKDGKFYHHVGYTTIYPKNMRRVKQ